MVQAGLFQSIGTTTGVTPQEEWCVHACGHDTTAGTLSWYPEACPFASSICVDDVPGDPPGNSTREAASMAIGPVQMIVLGFTHPNFHGEIIAELQRLHDEDTVRV